LSRIAETFDSSLLPEEERTPEVLLEPLIRPLIEMCDRTAAELSSELGAVFLINCFVLLRDVLLPYPNCTRAFVETLNERIETAGKAVADSETRSLLTRAHLYHCLVALRDEKNLENVLVVEGMDPKSLGESIKSLETMTLSLGDLILAMGACEKVQDNNTREGIKAQVVEQLVEAYAQFHQIVHDPNNNYPDAGQIVYYTPEQYKSLLEC
jgi:hypothetical protein